MKNPYLSLLKTSWKYALGERKKFILAYILFIAANICGSLKPLLYGGFIKSLQSQGSDYISSVWIYVGLFMGVYFLGWFFQGPGRLLERKLAFNIGKNFLDDLFYKILLLPINWHQNNHTGAIINRVRRAEEALKDFFQNGYTFLQVIIQFIISFCAIIYFSPIFALIGILSGISISTIILLFDKPYVKSLTEINAGQNKVSSKLSDSLKNILTIVTLGIEKHVHKQLVDSVGAIYRSYRKNTIAYELKWFTSGIVVDLTYCLIVVGYVYSNYNKDKTFDIAGLVVLIGFIDQFSTVFINIAYKYNQVVQYNTDVNAVNDIFDLFKSKKRILNHYPIPSVWNSIEIKDLCFSYEGNSGENAEGNYPNSEKLSNLNLCLKSGQKVALIGASGSGKSTFMGVLKGLYPPKQNSQIIVDGDDNYSWSNLPESVTFFPQEPEIFENTIRYNITFGLPYQESEVLWACRVACFTDVLEQLPDGLESLIHENGVNLSGGQKQRLALARGILASKRNSIVLLDESTSNIDQETEIKIYNELFDSFSDKLIICSIHRLSILDQFDYIYVFNNGKIIQEGTFSYISTLSMEKFDVSF